MNRDEIKWAPFDSLGHSKDILKELANRQKLSPKPRLSEDELNELQIKLTEAVHTKEPVLVTYYYHGLYYQKKGIITSIKKNDLKVYFQDHSSLYCEQIISLKLL